ncbi:MAG: hypothetical protein A2Z88_04060 [Omnitrophica WOR_2 bacterium GWA2_47_8]|nr:MAG: hypothetical protein A2Z88_04060 [Omnitrophica WOR_2 bacterium GWA2_47_8]
MLSSRQFEQNFPIFVKWSLWLVILFGVILRITNVTSNFMFFYDEGFYLNFNYPLLEIIDKHPPQDLGSFMQALYAVLRLSLGTGKALWFFIVDSRALWGGLDFFVFPKIVSTLAGLLTLPVVYLFTKRMTNSQATALLSAAILAVLPSHVLYSRLAMQESLSTLFFMLTLYFYVFPKELTWRTFLSSVLAAGVYFTNYRLIIVPLLIAFTEVIPGLLDKRLPNGRKLMWHTLIFFLLVFTIGSIDKGQNITTTFSWMFRQADLGKSQLDPINFLSYPYYLFRLESLVFGFLFFGNLYFLYKRDWHKAMPFLLVCFLMLIFSFAADKAARYLCVGLPLAAMGIALLLAESYHEKKKLSVHFGAELLMACLLLSLLPKAMAINRSRCAYRVVVDAIKMINPKAKILSTQPWIQNLYVKDRGDVQELPHNFESLLKRYQQGFQYIVLDPQAFISYTASKEKFTFRLEDYLAFLTQHVKPVKASGHFDEVVLERFVFEHSENLRTSLDFLNSRNKQLGAIYIYDLKDSIGKMLALAAQQTKKPSNE